MVDLLSCWDRQPHQNADFNFCRCLTGRIRVNCGLVGVLCQAAAPGHDVEPG